jgi:hypothetical protein
VPPILRIIVFVAVLVAVNRQAPGIAQAVLVLVALYLLLTHADQVRSTVAGSVDSWGGIWTWRNPVP